MSLNLCFVTVIGYHHLEFPFQTPTMLTHKVLNLGTREEQVKAIEQYFTDLGYFTENEHDTIEWATKTLKECERMLLDTSLCLTYT